MTIVAFPSRVSASCQATNRFFPELQLYPVVPRYFGLFTPPTRRNHSGKVTRVECQCLITVVIGKPQQAEGLA
jgi:hypothetical protein